MNATDQIRLKRHYAIVAHSPDVIELRHGVWNPVSFTLTDDSQTGQLFQLLKRLDGSVSPAQVAREMQVPREEVEALIDQLDQFGVLEAGPTTAFDYYLENLAPTLVGLEPPTVRPILLIGETSLTGHVERLLQSSSAQLDVQRAGPDDPAIELLQGDDTDWLYDGMAFHEKVTAFEGWKDRFVVFATSVINPLTFKVINRAALHHGFPWMHASMDGPFLLIGPIFLPRRGPCYECFEQRVVMNLRHDASYVAYKAALADQRANGAATPIEPMLEALLASHVALEIANFSHTDYSFTVGKVLAIFLPTMEFSYNEVLRVPACEGCGSVCERDDKELYFDLRTLLNS